MGTNLNFADKGEEMKVKFFCNSGANIKSTKDSGWLDTVEDLGFEDGEWEGLSDDEKYEHAAAWADENGLEIYFKEK